MLDLTLTIRKGSTDYVYDNVSVLSRSESVERSVSDLNVELGDVALAIGPDGSGSTRFLGESGPFAALGDPDTVYRAKLELDGTVILDGAVPMRSALFRSDERSIEVIITNQAAERFWEICGQLYISQLEWDFDNPLIKKEPVDTEHGGPTQKADYEELLSAQVETDSDSSGVGFNDVGRFVQRPWGRLKLAMEQLGFDVTIPSSLFPYAPNGGNDVYALFGAWKIETLVRQVSKLAGWAVVPSYQSYPSTDLAVEFVPSRWPTGSVPALPESDAVAPRDIENLESSNFAIAYQNDVASPARDPRDISENVVPKTFLQPYPWSVHAAADWQADRPATDQGVLFNSKRALEDPRNMQTDSTGTKWRFPQIEEENFVTVGSNFVYYGRPLVPQWEEREIGGTRETFDPEAVEDDKAYLFNLFLKGGNNWAVHHRRDTVTGETSGRAWAGAAWKGHEQRRGPRQELESEFLPVPVDLLDGFEYDGKRWVLRESEKSIQSGVEEVDALRPVGSVQDSEDRPDPIPNNTQIKWSVMKPGIEVRHVDPSGTNQDFFLAHWYPSATQYARETEYEYELLDNGSVIDNGEVISTSYVYALSSSGSGGQTWDVAFKVRPKAPNGDTGQYITLSVDTTQNTSLGYTPPDNDFLI